MKWTYFLIIIGLGVVVFAWVRSSSGLHRSVMVGNVQFFMEVADTIVLRAKGLSGHTPLGDREGMLFIFDLPTEDSFWMQGMLFPIDFIWVSRGEVVGVTENARPMSETGFMLYRPPMFVDRVIEVAAGTVKKFGVKPGDAVRYK